MFDDILVATDRHDRAEAPIRHRTSEERRFLARLSAITLELLFPTGRTTFEPDAPTDDIEIQSENATRHALTLCQIHGARLHVLFTVDAIRYDTTVAFARKPLVEEGEETIAGLLDAAERAGVEASGTVSVGRPSKLVLTYAADNSVDLIVLNARRSATRWSSLRGGLVSTVIRGAEVPVSVIPRRVGRPD